MQIYVSSPLEDPTSPYILWRDRVTKKVSYLVLYNILWCTSTNVVHALILWAGPSLMVRPMSCLVDTGGHTPTPYVLGLVNCYFGVVNIHACVLDF